MVAVVAATAAAGVVLDAVVVLISDGTGYDAMKTRQDKHQSFYMRVVRKALSQSEQTAKLAQFLVQTLR